MSIVSDRLGQALTITRDGDTAVMDAVLQPGSSVPPHRHLRQEETFRVVEGRMRMWVGRRRVTLGPGESVTVPHRTAHCVRNVGSGPLRLRAALTPGLRVDAFFTELFALAEGGHVSRGGRADRHAVTTLAGAFGDEAPLLPVLPIGIQQRLLRRMEDQPT